MPELIDANVLKSELCSVCDMHDCCVTVCETIRIINKQHTIKAKTVRRGRWIFGSSKTSCWMTCSICCKSQSGQTATFSYCPNCGARMDLRTPTEVQLDEADSVMMGGADNG